MLSHLIAPRFAGHYPPPRNAQQVNRLGIEISHGLMSEWLVDVAPCLKGWSSGWPIKYVLWATCSQMIRVCRRRTTIRNDEVRSAPACACTPVGSGVANLWWRTLSRAAVAARRRFAPEGLSPPSAGRCVWVRRSIQGHLFAFEAFYRPYALNDSDSMGGWANVALLLTNATGHFVFSGCIEETPPTEGPWGLITLDRVS
jgi:hypothetical protein